MNNKQLAKYPWIVQKAWIMQKCINNSASSEKLFIRKWEWNIGTKLKRNRGFTSQFYFLKISQEDSKKKLGKA